jgi:molecular chaperone GrpE
MTQGEDKDVLRAENPSTPAADASQPAAEPASEIEQLREKAARLEEEARANADRFLRERAELENFKKRLHREKAEALRFACEPLIRDLLPVIDNLERALVHGDDNGESILQGVRLVLKSLLDILRRHGVQRIEAAGARFDPNRHEAIAQVESEEHEPNQVVEQHHSGYLLHDRLLRPALVTVGRRKACAAAETAPKVETALKSD